MNSEYHNSDSRIDLSIVVPVYNSEATLSTLVERIFSAMNNSNIVFELIFVDDGSRDGSWKELQKLHQRHPEKIIAIQLMRNFGQHNALMCGFRRASGKYVVTIDDDLQNPPEEILKLLECIESNSFDLVYGNYEEKKHKSWRNLGSTIALSFYKKIFNSDITVTSFRIIRNELLQSILTYRLNFTNIDGLLAWNSTRVGSMIVEHHERAEGQSGYSISKLLMLAFNLFTNFSLLPLQIVTALGFIFALLGLGTGTYYLIQYMLSNIAIPGFASTIIAVMVLGGVQLLALGIMGEYIGRLHLNVNRKPQYTERAVLCVQKTRGEQTSLAHNESVNNVKNVNMDRQI